MMKSFGAYISNRLLSFAMCIFVLLFINVIVFGVTFRKTLMEDYGESSPRVMLEIVAASSTSAGISQEAEQKLCQNHIWALYLDQDGQCSWFLDLPDEVPRCYNIQDVALFSRGYIKDYPVFVQNMDDGLLVLGYPKDSYTKLTSNYYSIQSIRSFTLYVIGILAIDLLLLFSAYCFSRRKIIRSTGPIVAAVEALSDGTPVSLNIQGELSAVADSVNRVSQILSRQNEARANWISGVSHDIRTPLSMIMGYAGRIAGDSSVSGLIKEQAVIVQAQSIKIKELVQDLNLVSRLEYEMQPLHRESIRLSWVVRSYMAELLNTGAYDAYEIEIEIEPEAETAMLECDVRLISRAIGNLVQNSIRHNPQGCKIRITLVNRESALILTVADNGIGFSAEKLRELEEKPHYMESTDERLDLRHGLGLRIVRKIIKAHNGSMEIEPLEEGCKIILIF